MRLRERHTSWRERNASQASQSLHELSRYLEALHGAQHRLFSSSGLLEVRHLWLPILGQKHLWKGLSCCRLVLQQVASSTVMSDRAVVIW